MLASAEAGRASPAKKTRPCSRNENKSFPGDQSLSPLRNAGEVEMGWSCSIEREILRVEVRREGLDDPKIDDLPGCHSPETSKTQRGIRDVAEIRGRQSPVLRIGDA